MNLGLQWYLHLEKYFSRTVEPHESKTQKKTPENHELEPPPL